MKIELIKPRLLHRRLRYDTHVALALLPEYWEAGYNISDGDCRQYLEEAVNTLANPAKSSGCFLRVDITAVLVLLVPKDTGTLDLLGNHKFVLSSLNKFKQKDYKSWEAALTNWFDKN